MHQAQLSLTVGYLGSSPTATIPLPCLGLRDTSSAGNCEWLQAIPSDKLPHEVAHFAPETTQLEPQAKFMGGPHVSSNTALNKSVAATY